MTQNHGLLHILQHNFPQIWKNKFLNKDLLINETNLNYHIDVDIIEISFYPSAAFKINFKILFEPNFTHDFSFVTLLGTRINEERLNLLINLYNHNICEILLNIIVKIIFHSI